MVFHFQIRIVWQVMGGDGCWLGLRAGFHADHEPRVALGSRGPHQRTARGLHLPHTRIQTEAVLSHPKATG